MDSTVFTLLIVVAFVYMIIRQFTEQEITWRSLLILPALSIYGSYLELQSDFSHFAPAFLVMAMAVGVVPGLFAGLFRGQHTKVRLENASGVIYSKPELAALIALNASPLGTNLLVGMFSACASALFVVSVVVQKFLVYQQYNRYQTGNFAGQYQNMRSR